MRHLEAILLAVILALGGWFYFLRSQKPGPVARPVPKEDSRPLLAKIDDAEVYKNLTGKDRKTLKDLVLSYCVIKYHAESCFQYFTTCGEPCEPLLNTEQKKKVIAFYKNQRKKKVSALPQ